MNRVEAAYAVLRHVRPLHQYSARAVADLLEGTDVGLPLRAILLLVLDGGPQTVPNLGRELLVTRQGVQKVVDDGVRLGHLELHDNPAHARSRLVGLTEHGRTFLADLQRAEAANLESATAGIDPEDLARCADVIARLTDGVRRIAGEQADRLHPDVVAADRTGTD
ncbi:MarR family winged helix-turn-helix transcriptional regulator [Intrasporangium sp. YIM S08009]|uniref:MarR family winged helix-turn-helix transcriptional regulator n=1 Tax=Intrasporangium zincisolvens TaxID=3080018 RepID=UPI002B05E732|nr:MarR family winged helix-turn-helix transcriptional regulator [Intrasporangium sp. YIM S08009]